MGKRVENSPLQLAKRELLEIFGNRSLLAALMAAGVIAGLAGPFGTGDVLATLPRILYWLVLVGLSYTGASVVASVIFAHLQPHIRRIWITVLMAGLAAGLAVFALLLLVNTLVFGAHWDCAGCLWSLFVNVMAITTIITATLFYVTHRAEVDSPQQDRAVRLLQRLPLEKRGALVSLSADDHYTEVVTTKGRELLLLRLADAIAEAAPTRGMQVHRSHWVALDQIASARRDGQKAVLTMQNGSDIPVSRTYVKALKEAGVLPG